MPHESTRNTRRTATIVTQHASHPDYTVADAARRFLRAATDSSWIEAVLAGFDDFLIDHAACERKASAMAVSLICHYPDRRELVSAMADLAVEEMAHYREVIRLIEARGVALKADRKDAYVNRLRALLRRPREDYFQDRLLVAGIIEARGTERFALLAAGLEDKKLSDFYARLAASEARHHELFLALADVYFEPSANRARLAELLDAEAEIASALPARAALH